MTNVQVVFEYEEPEYCRLCLSEATEYNELSTMEEANMSDEHSITQVIRGLLQIDLDPASDQNSFICSTCVESLDEFYRYRTRCRLNNVSLKKKAIERKQRQIELAKSAIENTNVLDQVKDGEPIKVVIRMNAEGKASVRLQVQSKQSTDCPSRSTVAGPSSGSNETIPVAEQAALPAPQPSATTTGEGKVAPTQKEQIRLPIQDFYFYRTASANYGLIYGGYRYSASVPRKNRTYWICEQRKSHNCLTLLSVHKSYTAFFLNSGHNHEPPKVRTNIVIYKSREVIRDVIQKEQAKEQELAQKKIKQQKEKSNEELPEAALTPTVRIKAEPVQNGEEKSHDTVSVMLGDDLVPMDVVIKDEPDLSDSDSSTSSSSSSQVQVDGGDNLYIIQELT